MRHRKRIAQIEMKAAGDETMSLVFSGSAADTELGNDLPRIFNYSNIVRRSSVHTGFEFGRDFLRMIFVQHLRFFG